MPDLAVHLRAALPPGLAALVDAVASSAAAEGIPLYAVGGAVRDLLLGRPVKDVDLVVEGDAPAIARRAAEALGGRVTEHGRFGTATIHAEKQRLDVATARTERYTRPGALPEVTPGALTDDLRRRDFTVNAMAVRLSPPDAGTVVDPFHGSDDLKARRLKVLHDASFSDDATRILRGARYAARLGFELDPHTRTLAVDAVGNRLLDTLSGDRIRHEMALMLDEPEPGRAIATAADLGVWAAVDASVGDASAVRHMAATKPDDLGVTSNLRWLALLAQPLLPPEAEALIERLHMPTPWARVTRDVATIGAAKAISRADASPMDVCDVLDGRAPEAVWAVAVADSRPAARENTRRYLTEWRSIRPELDGEALLALGVPRGPALGRILRELRRARLNGHARSRSDDEALARKLAKAKDA